MKAASQMELALRDFAEGARQWPLWTRLAWHDIRQRYRRSVLGPMWVAIGMAIMAFAMGFLYAGMFGRSFDTFLPYLMAGLTVWALMAALVNEGCQVFIWEAYRIQQIALPYTAYVFRQITRNLIVAAHCLLPFVIVAVVMRVPVSWTTALALPGVVALAVNGFWVALLLGIAGVRFRDIPQIVTTVVQLAMFLTPVFWVPEMLDEDRLALVRMNPLYHFMEIIRTPLLGGVPSAESWLVVAKITVVGAVLALAVFVRCRRRIAYWV